MGKASYIFTGQGAQYLGMGKDLYENIPACKDVFDRADDILGFRLSEICFSGPEEELTKTDVCQPAILVHSAAVLAGMKEKGIGLEGGITGGLSLGEYTAMMFAGVLDFEQAVSLVRKRGQYMQEAADSVESGMASVLKMDPAGIQNVLDTVDGAVSIANLNCPGQTVISGEMDALDRAIEAIGEAGGRVIKLNVAGAFHSSVMEPAREKLKAEVEAAEFKKPEIPVFSNSTGEKTQDPDLLRKNIVDQLVSSVLWEECVRGMMDAGYSVFYDIGPGKVLAGLNKRISKDIETVSYDKIEDLV